VSTAFFLLAVSGQETPVPTKPFSLPHDTSLKRIAHISMISKPNEGVTMNTIVANVMKSEAEKSRIDTSSLKTIALFCGIGLLVSLFCVMSFGLDLSVGFFDNEF
jgi:hypothetical protein